MLQEDLDSTAKRTCTSISTFWWKGTITCLSLVLARLKRVFDLKPVAEKNLLKTSTTHPFNKYAKSTYDHYHGRRKLRGVQEEEAQGKLQLATIYCIVLMIF